jgi:hypothetical protein
MLTRGPSIGAALLAMAAMTAAGCGGESKFKNDPRPPAPVQLTGVITDKGVTVSPDRVGAGPVILLISNQTQQAHTITLDGTDTKDTVGPINPLDTAKVQQTLEQGDYQVKAGSSKALSKELKAGTLTVGPERKDSSNTTQLP